MSSMKTYFQTSTGLLRWALRRLIFLVPIVFIIAWISNPHGPVGGGFYLVGLAVFIPMFLLRSIAGPFDGPLLWTLALVLEASYLVAILMCGRWLYMRVKNTNG